MGFWIEVWVGTGKSDSGGSCDMTSIRGMLVCVESLWSFCYWRHFGWHSVTIELFLVHSSVVRMFGPTDWHVSSWSLWNLCPERARPGRRDLGSGGAVSMALSQVHGQIGDDMGWAVCWCVGYIGKFEGTCTFLVSSYALRKVTTRTAFMSGGFRLVSWLGAREGWSFGAWCRSFSGTWQMLFCGQDHCFGIVSTCQWLPVGILRWSMNPRSRYWGQPWAWV